MKTLMIDYSNDDDNNNNDDDKLMEQVPKQFSSHQGSLSGDIYD